MPGTEVFGIEEKKEVQDVLDSGVLFRYNHDDLRNGHWKAKTFENELSEYLGVNHTHLCSSGTTAVSLALAACGIGAGDQVIVPPFTYIATVEAVLNAGAIPVFAEIDETLCLSPEGIEAVLTPDTKAVCLVHMCGAPAKIEAIVQLCEEKGVILIEDSAQALGASHNGKYIGTFGKAGCFSFDFFKIITAGEGGAVITNERAVYENAHMYSDHGHDHIGNNRGAEKHPVLGNNFRISELHAAVVLAQLRKIDFILEKQRSNKKVLHETLSKFPEISFRLILDDAGDSATFFSFFLPDEQTARKAVAAFAEHGIAHAYWYDNNFHYIKNWEHLRNMRTVSKLPITMFNSPQDYSKLQFPQSDNIVGRLISLQIKVTWTESELDNYCKKITNALKFVL